jgi:CMP/dCMP kinase
MEARGTATSGATPEEAGKIRVVTISRLYGGGGGEVAARLARRLGWHLVDHEVVERVARALGITQEEAEERDEQMEGWLDRMLSSVAMAYPETSCQAPLTSHAQAERYKKALHSVILAAANEGDVVIVGRAGQVVLRDRRDVLRALVVAPLDARIRYVQRREGLDEAEARRRIEQKDRDRARFLHEHYGVHATDPLLYDLTINTGVLTLDDAVELICRAMELKARQIETPPEQLGPGAGLAPYPGRPGDVPTPEDGGERS